MVDDDRGLLNRLATRAALTAGRDAARSALDDVLLGPDEKAARQAARARVQKRRLVVAVVVATVTGIGVIALFQLLASLWLWAMGFVVVAGVVGVAAVLLKPRVDALRVRLGAGRAARAAKQQALAQAEQQRHALVAAAQKEEQAQRQLDDELARLKRQAGR
jgi:hypothetical protein